MSDTGHLLLHFRHRTDTARRISHLRGVSCVSFFARPKCLGVRATKASAAWITSLRAGGTRPASQRPLSRHFSNQRALLIGRSRV